MVSLSMFQRVLAALRPHARLLLVGDPDQLASVEAGAVLSDLDSLPATSAVGAGVSRLEHNHRIDPDRPELAELAAAIRRGDEEAVLGVLRGGGAIRWHEVDDDAVLLPAEVLDDVRHRCLEVTRVMGPAARAGDAATAVSALDRHRLLCAHSRGPRGVTHWNGVVQRWVVDDDPEAGARFDGRYAGMPVMLTVNDYENKVWNGDTGVVLAGPQRLEVVVGRGCHAVAADRPHPDRGRQHDVRHHGAQEPGLGVRRPHPRPAARGLAPRHPRDAVHRSDPRPQRRARGRVGAGGARVREPPRAARHRPRATARRYGGAMKVTGIVVGALVLVMGLVWTLQGAGALTGSSPMVGESLWVVLGIITMLVGALIAWLGLRRSPRRPGEPR